MDIDSARTRLAELRAHDGRVDAAELDEIWAALEVVRPEEILGEWKGSELDTGHPLCGRLAAAGWYGKTFGSVRDAQPLIMRAPDGSLYSNIDLGKGAASLWMVEYRGESTATMVYDGRPIFDHFKRVDDRTLLGTMNGKDNELVTFPEGGPTYYFVLERV